jgi:hypothetical protein
MGRLDFATIPFKNRHVNIRGELLTQNFRGLFVVFLVASPADWIFARIPQFFITACYGGHAPKFPT